MNEVKKGSFLQPVERAAPASPLQGFPYSNVLQGKPIHGLISSSTAHGNIQLDAITHSGIMLSEGVTIIVDEEVINDIGPQTFKVLIVLLDKVTTQLPHNSTITAEAINRGRTVRLSIAEFMEGCNIKDIKHARETLNVAIKTLYGVSLEWPEEVYEKPEGRKRVIKVKKHHRMRITDHTITQNEGKPIKRGIAEFRFSFDMAEYLTNAYIMPYHKALLHINTHDNPYSIPIGWKLCTLHNLNFGKPNQDTTTVKTLLKAAKGLPRYEDIAATGEIYRRIIERFDRDLSALVNVGQLLTYWYFNDKGDKIDSSQLGLLSYAEFSALSIHYEMKDYPNQTPRMESGRQKISAAYSRRKSNEKEAKQ